jgi:hypothetical protein
VKRLYLLTLLSVILATCIFIFKPREATTIPAGQGLVVPKDWLVSNNKPVTPAADVRPADQTFLTFPEWFLVFSPEEQAAYFKYHTSTSFPFMSHTAQIWESYKIVNDQIKDDFPVNKGYHFMIWVIGSSATIEYSVKACYETLVGRITDTGIPLTEEDTFNAVFNQAYVDFIKDDPWYKFNFKKRLADLYTQTPVLGKQIFRKLERRYMLTSELLVKWSYGKLIGLGSQEIYEAPIMNTAVVLANDSIVYLPRYDRFTPAIATLAEQGYSFKEIAGNNSAILLTILTSEKYSAFNGSKILFTQPVSSQSGRERIALVVPVPKLNQLLLQLRQNNIDIEHIFDY